jgi:hypothetical protein
MKRTQDIRQDQGIQRLENIRQAIRDSLTLKALLSAILLATILLTTGYLLDRLWLQAPVIFLVGLLWAVCVLRAIRWVASLLFLFLMGAAAIGYMAGLSHVLMLAAGCTIVLAWDLHYFEGRLLDLEEPATKAMEKQHLKRVLMVLGFSFVGIVVDSMLGIRIKFIALVFVTVLAILILNQVMLQVRMAGRPKKPKKDDVSPE